MLFLSASRTHREMFIFYCCSCCCCCCCFAFSVEKRKHIKRCDVSTVNDLWQPPKLHHKNINMKKKTHHRLSNEHKVCFDTYIVDDFTFFFFSSFGSCELPCCVFVFLFQLPKVRQVWTYAASKCIFDFFFLHHNKILSTVSLSLSIEMEILYLKNDSKYCKCIVNWKLKWNSNRKLWKYFPK